jgi:hypothetical protein
VQCSAVQLIKLITNPWKMKKRGVVGRHGLANSPGVEGGGGRWREVEGGGGYIATPHVCINVCM